jgi:hypothetical protein
MMITLILLPHGEAIHGCTTDKTIDTLSNGAILIHLLTTLVMLIRIYIYNKYIYTNLKYYRPA